MKKLIALVLAVVMCMSLVACGGNTDTTTEAPTEAQKIDYSSMTAEEKEAAREEIRYAFSLLLDRNYIVEEIAQGGQVPASSFVAMGMTNPDGTEFYKTAGPNADFDGYYNVAKDAYEANYAKACEILMKYYEYDEATGKFTNIPTLTYLYNTSDAHKAIGEYIQAALAAVGVNVQLENQEWNTFLNTRKDGNYSIARNGWLADYSDPICFIDMWTSGSGNNDIQFGRGANKDLKMYSIDLTPFGSTLKVENGTWAEAFDAAIAEIKACTNEENRYGMMHAAEDLLMQTGAITPLYFYTDLFMIDDQVNGFFSNPLGYKYFMFSDFGGKTDSLSVCIASEPDTLDPALNSAVDGATMLAHLFAGLAKWSQDASGKLLLIPDQAEELVEGVVNADGTVTYTYTLKDNKWSDGKPVTAKDYEFAWKRAASTELGADYGYMFEVVKGYGTDNKDDLAVKALDDKTLEVTLANSVAYWNELLAFPTYFPVREDVVSNEAWATDPATYVCNGPYKMAAWDHNSVITLQKNDGFVDASTVTMKELKFFLSDDANNMLSNFKNGTWQLIDDVPTNEIASLKEEYPTEFVVAGQIGTYYVCFNINEELLPQ